MIKIAVDGMGGDFAPYEIVEGIKLALKEIKDIEIIITGDETQIKKLLSDFKSDNIQIIHTKDVITMFDKPREALLKKKDSSMHKAIELVKEKKAHGMVTAGNTGAYMAISLFTLGRLKNVSRPGIGVVLPFIDNTQGVILDVGASVDISARELFVFAILGQAFLSTLTKRKDITIGLLNIGSEEEKGTKVIKETYKLFKESFKNFVGNVEPHELLYHKADVIVTDGFTGNILEKSYEGAIGFTVDVLKKEIKKSFINKIGAYLLKNALKETFNKLNYEHFGGSPLLGVDGISIKAHGRSKRIAIKNAIKVCYELAKNELLENFKKELEKIDLTNDELQN